MNLARRNHGPALLLMGGGIESSALAYAMKPTTALVIDYGQAPAQGEIRAAGAVAHSLGIELHTLAIDAHAIGSGLLSSGARGLAAAQDGAALHSSYSPSPEWWPYRNQLLVTLAAAWAYGRGLEELLVGSVLGDGDRHADGRADFYNALDTLLSLQEGGLRVSAPAIALTTEELLTHSQVPNSVLGWTHSCHVSRYACGRCPGCYKAETVLTHRNST
jgi:7-cyano-7-deazaguanine synthase